MRPYMMGLETFPPDGLTTRSMAPVTDVRPSSTAARAADLVERNMMDRERLGPVFSGDVNKHTIETQITV